MRLGESGRVPDDVLGLTPEDLGPVGRCYREHKGLRRSVESLESQPWLPKSARELAESVLMAIGRPPVEPLVAEADMPESWEDSWRSLCSWAAPQRRDLPGRLRLARRAMELLTGKWPWASVWEPACPPRTPPWVDSLLGRDSRVVLDYAPLTDCSCASCVSRRSEIAAARLRFSRLRS